MESIEVKVVMACELSQLTAYWTAQNLVSALLHDVTTVLEQSRLCSCIRSDCDWTGLQKSVTGS